MYSVVKKAPGFPARYRTPHAPVVVAAAHDAVEVGAAPVEILALRVDDLAEEPGLEDPAHRIALGAERRRLVHHVDPARALHRVNELRHGKAKGQRKRPWRPLPFSLRYVGVFKLRGGK